MTDKELVNLIDKYAIYYYRKFKHVWKIYAEHEEIRGILSEQAVKARRLHAALEKKDASERTWIIKAFKNSMENYRQYLWTRQQSEGKTFSR